MKTTVALALLLISVLLVSCGRAAETPAAAPPAAEPDPAATAMSTVPPAGYTPVENPTWGRAVVTAQKDHLVKFEAKFRELSGLNDADAMEAVQVGCTAGCAELSTGDPDFLEYVFPREYPNILSIFAQAWDFTQAEGNDPEFTLSFDVDMVSPDCGLPNPQPCNYMPYCPGDKCGYPPASGACNRC